MPNNGKFSTGNNAAKKSLTKEIARNAVQKDLWLVASVLADVALEDIEAYLKENNIKLSLMATILIDKVREGDTKTLYWMTEMIAGKAAQTIDTSITTKEPLVLKYAVDNK